MRVLKRFVIQLIKRHLWKLPQGMLDRAIVYSILHGQFKRLFQTNRITGREDLWEYTLETIGRNRKVLFLEFGVYKGESFRYFAATLTNPGSRLIGFDSFEGLPEDWGHRPAGSYSAGGVLPEMDDPRVLFKAGWFQETLPLQEFDVTAYDAVLVHMDADLYSSSLFVLSELWRKFNNIYVIFDEFVGDETRALFNFTQAFPCDVEFIAHDAMPPKRVACYITGMRGIHRSDK